MTAPTLTASRSVMTLVHAYESDADGNSEALFARPDATDRRRTLSLDYESWDDMGRPDQVTITVEPGARLNTAQAEG